MSEIKALQSAVKKILGLTDDSLADLLYDKSDDESKDPVIKKDATKIILDKNAEKISELKQLATDKYNDGVKETTKNLMTDFETKFKTKVGFESDKKGLDLVIGYAESVKGSTPTDPTEDQVKKTSWYTELEQNQIQAVKDATGKIEQEFNDFKNGINNKEKSNVLKTRAWEKTLKLNPVIPDGLPGENLKNNYLRAFEEYSSSQDNGTEVILNKEGKRHENNQGIGVTFDELITDLSGKYLTFAKQDGKGSPGNEGGEGGDSGELVITSKEQFIELAEKYKGNIEMGSKISKAWTSYKDKQ